MTTKDTFLHTVSQALGRDAIPAAPTPLEYSDSVQEAYYKDAGPAELRQLFIENSKVAGTLVHECTMDALNDTIKTVITELGEGPILVAECELLKEQNTVAVLGEIHSKVHIWDTAQSREANIENAESAGVGVSTVQAALAETGTVMVYSHKNHGRSVTLLPTTTIFIIREEQIVPRLTGSMHQIMEHQAAGLPASINFISGASSTADIELVRVQGVHGPVQIAYIIVT